MKSILTILLMALTLTVSAQKIRFTDSTNQWHTEGAYPDCPFFTNDFYYDTNAVWHGQTYRSLHQSKNGSWSCAGTGTFSTGYFIREDTATNIVYYTFMNSDSIEHVLYNYNWNVGDTVRCGSMLDSVTAVDSITINGLIHKIWYLQTDYGGDIKSFTIVEGVGCTESPFAHAQRPSCFEYLEHLRCFRQDSTYPIFKLRDLSCVIMIDDTFRNGAGCATLITPKLFHSEAVSILPNPTINNIDIYTTGQFHNNTTILSYDLTGKCIFIGQIDDQVSNATINTSSWPTGLYMVIIQNNTGILKKEKIVVQH